LIRDGSIREVAGSGSARIGRPAQSIGLVADAHYVAGVHIGAINGQAVITDVTTQEMTRRSFDYNPDDPDHIISKACQTVTELSSELKLDAGRLIGIGIGVPCAVDANRRVALGPRS
jgi:predicted NBD/HSP70 family sugar kinase